MPYFLFGFEQFGRAGLGRDQAPARLERVEALYPFQPVGQPIYSDGRVLTAAQLPTLALPELLAHAAKLPADLQLRLTTPLRVKTKGAFIETIDLPALIQAIGWRLNALATFHGDGPWDCNYRPLIEAARAVAIEQAMVRWEDWERTSTRGGERRTLKMGGIVGSTRLRNVPLELRALLLAGSLLHVGKGCVFGLGGMHSS